MKCDKLKAYKGDVTIPVYGTIADAEVYLKKDVDETIAELKQKLEDVNELVKESKELLKESQKMHQRCADNAIKKIRHQKYKRCLAMARWCHSMWILLRDEHETKRSVFYWRWWNLWLELAKKFKEAK